MHRRPLNTPRLVLACLAAACVAAAVLAAPARPAHAATFTVISALDNPDASPGNGSCSIGPPVAVCTLRAAIQEANALAGTDTIILDIGLPEGTYTYSPATPLPAITAPVTISKSADGGQLVLDGSAAGVGLAADGIVIRSTGVSISGFAIVNFGDDGILIDGAGGGGGATITGMRVGIDYSDVAAPNNADGVNIFNSGNNVIGGTTATQRNIISANLDGGVQISGANGDNNTVLGNYIGLDGTGTLDRGNGVQGVSIAGGSNNIIGGTAAGARNVISGNTQDGVQIISAPNNSVLGNYIGTDYTGELDRGNGSSGVLISGFALIGASSNTIGGATAAARNIISGNDVDGIRILSTYSDVIQGNYIGTDDDGAQQIANAFSGINASQAHFLQVGGSAAGQRNVIAGNDDEVRVQLSDDVIIAGNFIGVDATGLVGIGPGDSYNAVLLDDVRRSTVGGTTAGDANRITNSYYGVHIIDGDANSVLGNYIGAGPAGSSVANYMGVLVDDFLTILPHRIGNGAASGRNYISGNSVSEVRLSNSAHKVVQGNYIGTIDGITATSSGLGTGIYVSGGTALIGGAAAGQGNVIAAQFSGIILFSTLSSPVIQGNYIGTNAAGTAALPNVNGIQIQGTGGNATIGGIEAGMGNVISGNGDGIHISSGFASTATIAGNLIGLDASGDLPLANTNGIVIPAETAYTTIVGGPDPGARNLIQHNTAFGISISDSGNTVDGNVITDNGSDGIAVLDGANNLLTRNVIFDNGGLGIDLGDNGVTPNDAADPDAGANLLQNYPSLTSALAHVNSLTIDGLLDSTPNTSFVLDFYSSPGCDPSGYGEGAAFLGSAPAATGPSNLLPFSILLAGEPSMVPPGHTHITTTVTDPANNTSEFSNCALIVPDPDFDSDGLLDAADNCPNNANPLQEHSDRNFIDQTPPSTQDDRTWPNSDPTGDACDTDDDNDGIVDTLEPAGCNASGALSPTNRDTDGDRFLDGAECAVGTNPALNTSKPTIAACAAYLGVASTADTDGDRLRDHIEFCNYNTDPNDADTDKDQDGFPTTGLAKDGCEAASFNNDRIVTSGDQLLLAIEIAREVTPSLRLVSMDINKDGVVSSGDQLLQVQFMDPPGQCP